MDMNNFDPESLEDIARLLTKDKGKDSKEMKFFIDYVEMFVHVYMTTNYEINLKIEPSWAVDSKSETEFELRQQFIKLQNAYSKHMVDEVKLYLQQRDTRTLVQLNDLVEKIKKENVQE